MKIDKRVLRRFYSIICNYLVMLKLGKFSEKLILLNHVYILYYIFLTKRNLIGCFELTCPIISQKDTPNQM